MINRMDQERCTCGSDDCPNCFPMGSPYEGDELPTLSEARGRLPDAKSIADDCVVAVADIAKGETVVKQSEVWNPKWITPKMTVEYAAAQCRLRGYGLMKARFDPTMGLTIIAVKR